MSASYQSKKATSGYERPQNRCFEHASQFTYSYRKEYTSTLNDFKIPLQTLFYHDAI